MSFRQTATVAVLILSLGLLTAPAARANHTGTGVYLNGVELTLQQIAYYAQTSGITPRQGHYVSGNGCVAHLESGEVYCQQTQYQGRGAGGGYGYSGGQGNPWFNRGSDYSGGYSVGGDGSGCVYTPNWSNC